MGSVLGFVGSAIGGLFDAYGSMKQGKIAEQNAKANAAILMQQAAAQAEAQRAEGRAYERRSQMDLLDANNQVFNAKEELRQGEIAQEKANIEQMKGEREAARRSRLLAQEIGEQYAQFAGNGFAVDAAPTDTFGSIIKSTATEGQADISTILENANLNMWTFEEEKRTQQKNAANSLAGANNYVFKARSDQASAQDARAAAATTMANAQAQANQMIKEGKQIRKASKWNALTKIASAGFGGVSSWYQNGGSANLWGGNPSASAGW